MQVKVCVLLMSLSFSALYVLITLSLCFAQTRFPQALCGPLAAGPPDVSHV